MDTNGSDNRYIIFGSLDETAYIFKRILNLKGDNNCFKDAFEYNIFNNLLPLERI